MTEKSIESMVEAPRGAGDGRAEFVQSSANRLGIGRLRDSNSLRATVEYFDAPTQEERPVRRVPLSSIRKVSLPVQTRVHHRDPKTGRWRVGRAVEHSDSKYRVKFPNRVEEWVDPEELFVRWKCPIEDPTDHLAMQLNETPLWYERRAEFIASTTQQRAAAAGMTGLLSSSISLEPHQIEVARRVMQDPVQRYLLADEVGLGKTVEAGVLIRQYVLDQPADHVVYIVVPQQLTEQWRRELCEKFDLSRWLHRTIHVLASSDGDALESMKHGQGMLVIDEAHHVANWAQSPANDERKRYELLRGAADRAERLLLLSATPVRRRADELFPPIVRTVWLDGQLQPLDRAALRPEIVERYAKGVSSIGQDFNLNAERWKQIEGMYERANWWDLCRGARAAAGQALTEQIELRRLTESHARRASERARRSSEQLRSRLVYLPPRSRDDEQAQIDLIGRLDAAIAGGIVKPSVRCDSLQVMFFSAIDPFPKQAGGGEG